MRIIVISELVMGTVSPASGTLETAAISTSFMIQKCLEGSRGAVHRPPWSSRFRRSSHAHGALHKHSEIVKSDNNGSLLGIFAHEHIIPGAVPLFNSVQFIYTW